MRGKYGWSLAGVLVILILTATALVNQRPAQGQVARTGSGPAMFLQLGDIKGDSAEVNHKEWIDIQSIQWGVANLSSESSGGGAGAGKATASDVTITKQLDRATAKLFERCATGKHFDKVTIDFVRSSGEKPYYRIELEKVVISSFQQSGGGDRPQESLSLNYARIKVTYTPQNRNGTSGMPVEGSFDFSENMTR